LTCLSQACCHRSQSSRQFYQMYWGGTKKRARCHWLINSHQFCFPGWFRSKFGWGRGITGGFHGQGQRLVFGCGCLMAEVEQDIPDILYQQPVYRVPIAPCTLYGTSSGPQKSLDDNLFKYLSQSLGGHYLTQINLIRVFGSLFDLMCYGLSFQSSWAPLVTKGKLDHRV
jgi:hypothetical protein